MTVNERIGLEATLSRIDRSQFAEIIAVDGHSTDGTVEYCESHGVRVIRQVGKGLPEAFELAVKNTTSDVLVAFSPDGNSIPEKLPELCAKMREGYDMVVVSRYLADAKSEDDDVVTGFGNWFFTTLVNVLFGARYTDILVIYRAYTRELIAKAQLIDQSQGHWLRQRLVYLNSWEVGAVTRAARLGLKVGEIPGSEPARIGGERKLKVIRQGLGILAQILDDFFLFWPATRR
ncbi:MAG: glycosyltransferase [Rhodospirillales bacterium]|nr:glycosyltransferase [Rhodospirillales bacterium]